MPERYIKLIQDVLSPDLLKPEYRELNIGNPMYGHCYAATEALFHLIGGLDSGWFPVRGKDENGVTHWWLQNQQQLPSTHFWNLYRPQHLGIMVYMIRLLILILEILLKLLHDASTHLSLSP